MNTSTIPDDIRRYVIQCVPSVPYIEAVLLMREGRDMVWQPEILARRLYVNEDEALRLLSRLKADGLAAAQSGNGPGYRFAPETDDLRELWDRLAATYARHLIEVSTLIHGRSGGKAQMLADAFVWRKEK
jgi:hypothetical protein